jgi:hypothetical protein
LSCMFLRWHTVQFIENAVWVVGKLSS